MKFSPRRPIKSFQDLEVYQKLLAVSVAVAKRIGTIDDGKSKIGQEDRQSKIENENLSSNFNSQNTIFYRQSSIVKVALDLPIKIATAHSIRFSDKARGIAILEEVMLGTNILIVYLEQYRDIENKDIELEFFEEQINSLSVCRWKVMHLARSWEKFSLAHTE